MKTCAALVVFLCLCLAEDQLRGDSIGMEDPALDTTLTQETLPSDLQSVLRNMSAQLTEQGMELSNTKKELEVKLQASESKVEVLEKLVQEQRAVLEKLEERQTEQEANANSIGSQLEELKNEMEETRVAFSASLLSAGNGHVGPFSAPTLLVYKHVITNVGNSYNANTGAFTAPVRGVYSFYLSVHGYGHPGIPNAVTLHKNGEHVLMVLVQQPNYWVTASNGASLQLEMGDVVQVELWPGARVWDEQNHLTTFSGHLLFTL